MRKSFIGNLITIILYLLFIVGIICLFFIPDLYNILSDKYVDLFNNHSIYYKIAFYACYILSLSIVFFLTKIFNDIYKDTPFKIEIVKYLKIIACIFMLLAIIIAIKVIFIPTILSLAMIVVTFIASLSFYILGQVFKCAINYKEEVDYTI